MADKNQHRDDVKKLGELIKDIKVAMLTTMEEDGTLRSRPMMTQQAEFDGDLWFFTGASAAKVHEIQGEQHVNVSYAEPGDQRYVSVSGAAELVRDAEKMRELWNPVYKAWFPGGLDDPDLALLKVNVSQAEYWDAPSGKMVMLAGFIKSLATGERFEGGENRKIDL
jgi:general stress protein 26